MTDWADVAAAANALGLAAEGFHPGAEDDAPEGAQTIVLFGYGGSGMWSAFSASPEATDGLPDPLDRWSARALGGLADTFDATLILPNDGPPYPPFFAWAQRAGPVWGSRLGMLIHAERGVWVSYRGALAFRDRLNLPPAITGDRPCDACDAPCLTACPVSAFGADGYDADACAAHIATPQGADCLTTGCRARRICPVGRGFVQAPEQARHHMSAFLNARRSAADRAG